MKKSTLLILLLCAAISMQAQMGALGGLAGQILSRQKRAQVQKHLFFNMNMTYPVSLTKTITGGQIVIPPTYLSAEYGIYENITVGIMAGLVRTKSSGTVQALANDLRQGNIDINNIDILNLANTLFGTGSTNTETYEVRASSTLIGLSFKYNFIGNDRLNLFMVNRTGIKIKNVSKDYEGTGNAIVDEVVNVAEGSSGIFSSFSFGGNIYIDKNNKWALSPEIGWGPGWGDGFSITGNPLLITIGATYHRKPKKPVVPKLK